MREILGLDVCHHRIISHPNFLFSLTQTAF